MVECPGSREHLVPTRIGHRAELLPQHFGWWRGGTALVFFLARLPPARDGAGDGDRDCPRAEVLVAGVGLAVAAG